MPGGETPRGAATTGLVTIPASRQLEYHTHPYTEAVTLLSGAVVIDVEGRRYTLAPFDNIVVPSGLTHAALNPTSSQPAVMHVAMATDQPNHTFVDRFFSRGRCTMRPWARKGRNT